MRISTAVLFLLLSFAGWAGQIPSHIYTAMEGRTGLTGPAKTAVAENLDYYLTGAQGPDTIGIIQYELQKISFFNSVNDETHYSPQKALLACNILTRAKTDQERAFALGWLTHYVNDINVHAVVNNYGGYYGEHPLHHKILEQIECKQVFTRHSDVVTKTLATTIPAQLGAEFPLFIFDAYHDTYPEEPNYKPEARHWGVVSNRDYFGEQMDKAGSWCLTAEKGFYTAASSGTGDQGLHLATVPFPYMPGNVDYEHFQHAIQITDIETFPDHLNVTANVNDSRLYGRFTVDWETATKKAIADTRVLLAAASEYVAKPTPDTRQALLKLIPNQNLDQPYPDFKADAVFPGDKDVAKLHYQVKLTPLPVAGKTAGGPVALEGETDTLSYAEQAPDFYGSRATRITFTIPFKANLASYAFSVKLGMTGKEDFTHDEYRNVVWTQVDGRHPGAWISDVGAIRLGEPFTVTVAIPPALRGKKGMRRWAVMTPQHVITVSDLVSLDMDAWGKEVRPDVEILEEKVTPTTITATLQLTDMVAWEKQILGENRLLFVWSPYGTPDDFLGAEAAAQAGKELLAVHEKVATTKEFAEQEQTLLAFLAALEKEQITEAERERRLVQRFAELMATTRLPEARDVAEKAAIVTAFYDLPFQCATAATVNATALAFPLASGWKEEAPPTPLLFHDRQHATKSDEQKGHDNGPPLWSINATLDTAWCAWSTKAEQALAQECAIATKQPLTVGAYQGTLYLERGDGRTALEYGVVGRALLHRGYTGLKITFNIKGTAGQFIGSDGKTYDGKEAMLHFIDKTQQEIDRMLEGFTTRSVP